MQNKLRYNISGEKKVIKHIEVTTTNYTKTFIYCECKTITKWSDVSTDEWEEKEEYYIDRATGTKYILSGSTLSVISSSGTITINNFSNGQLGIHLSEKETIDKKNVERDVFLQEDFCSPLILDINNNGTSSTGLGNSQTYFDMDGNGFKERTAWVEQGDGLLVLDRNGNGSELFGNFTPLSTGNSANDGFEALLQYDENHDGVIDHNDAVYNQLKVWMDDNANGITDTGELKTLQEAKVASVKLNPYEALLSFYDSNANNMIDTQDEVYDYILLRHDDNGGVTLFVPQTDNETAKKLFDTPQPHDPLVLDLNQDGKISTIALADSQVYFDLTGDGVKERVGWIAPQDGLLVYDKNMNGKIDGINEVFGKDGLSGFAELRAVADTNYDNIIDRRDALFSQLKVWQDTNSDGISQASELKSLSSAGVKNIELNVIGTNINLNGNFLSEAGRYGDSTGTRSLAADIELTFDSRNTTVDTSLIPDYTIHPEAEALPKLRGYGVVYNSEIAYNINPHLISIAQSLTSDLSTLAQGFDQYLAEYSGLNTMLRTVQDKYALLSTPILSDMDKKVWIYEHFMGVNRFSSVIESRILSTAEAMQTGGSATVSAGSYNTTNVNTAYNKLHERYEAMFALQTLYPQIMNTMTYDVTIDEFVISDTTTLTQNVTDYLNNPNNTVEAKLYLCDAINDIKPKKKVA